MTGAPLVTVLVPTFNRASLLQETLDSALAQDHPALEVLVIDDGSSDDTPDVLRDYERRHRGVLRWERQENSGQPVAVNRGFEAARGELVCLLSDDDLLEPGAVSAFAAALAERPDAPVAYGDFILIDEEGRELAYYATMDHELALELHECALGPGATVRRADALAVGGWDPSLRTCPDFDFWLRMSLRGRFVRVDGAYSRYRKHAGSISVAEQGLLMARECVGLLDRFFSRPDLPAERLATKAAAYRNAYFRAATYTARGEVNGPGERFVVEDRLAPELVRPAGENRRAHGGKPRLRSTFRRSEELHHEVDRLHAEIRDRDRTIQRQHERIERQHETIERQHETIDWLHAEVAKRDAMIRELGGRPEEVVGG